MSGRIRSFLAAWVALLLAIPIPLLAQSSECNGCVLGLYDDAAMTRSSGQLTGTSKDIFLGIRYSPGATAELSSIEFGISGLSDFVVSVSPMDSPSIILGDPAVPSGIDTLTLTGGMNIGWATCLSGDRVLAKLTLRPRTQWPEGGALRVTHRFPPGNPTIPFPAISRCDAPLYTVSKVSGGMYLYGPEGPPACTVTALDTDFGRVPEGRSATLTFHIENTGGGILEGTVGEACPEFAFVPLFPIPGDPHYALAHGERRSFALRFTPASPAENACTVSLGSECDSLRFTAQSTPVIPIRSLQENRSMYVDSIVTIEGQPFIPPKGVDGSMSGWLQDASGRGLRLIVTSLVPLLQDPGNRLRVRGRLRSDNIFLDMANLRLESIEFSVLESSGNPAVSPLVLGQGGLRDATLSGTYVEILTRFEGSETVGSEKQLWVDDGTGNALVRTPTAPDLEIFETIVARGAAHQIDWFGRIMPGLHVSRPTDVFAYGHLDVPPAGGSMGLVIDVPIQIRNNGYPVDAFGFRFVYDADALTFQGGSCCGLAAGWPDCEVQVAGTDTLIVHASGPIPIPPQSEGDIVCLRFTVQTCGPSILKLVDLRGDATLMDTGNGQFACSECVADGDVNEDGVLTPADARCTFDTYLHDGQVSAECAAAGPCAAVHGDVDCDTQVLPGDALHIFDRWLRDSGPPHECFARRVLDAAETFRIGSSRAIEDGPGEVAISVERLAAAGNAAFAARVDFDPSTMEFVELRPTAGANWPGLAARSIEPGRLLVGGFAASLPAGDPGSWISVGDLIFRVRSGAADVRVEWKQRWITPGLPGVPESTNIPSRLVVGLPHPNPARGGTVALDVSVPAGDATRFEIQVVDVRGRIVRELHSGQLAPGRNSIGWDRKDARGSRVAAGLYVLRVRAGERLERRKLVVLE